MNIPLGSPPAPAEQYAHSEIRDGMRIDWNVPIRMTDGVTLRADIFRPVNVGKYPVILSYGTYAKGLAYQEGYPAQWKKMVEDYPEILEGSTNNYQNWEVTDPERWVPHDYVVVRVDSRGAGWSEGLLDPFQPRETNDAVECVEWAGTQQWSNGKVGMLGVSYYAVMQWRVAERSPKHLAAIIPWEGLNDYYRDLMRHGGILSEFMKRWAVIQSETVQYGVGERAMKNPNNGISVAGPVTFTKERLAENRKDGWLEAAKRPFDDDWYRQRSVDLSKVVVPLLSCANWGGQGIHPRGNFNGYLEAGSQQKWLEVHGDSHWSLFSSGYGLAVQKCFFDHFLHGIDNGWEKTPAVALNVRHPGEKFVLRHENEWPIARTKWTKLYLYPERKALGRMPAASAQAVEYDAVGDGVTFYMAPMERDTEITGPMMSKLFISSSTTDADLFLIVQLFDPDGKELTFMGSTDPNTPIANGWLRASHRALDPAKSTFFRPYHPHDRAEPLVPGNVYECDIEIVTSCIVVPKGWRLALTVLGKDYEYTGELSEFAKKFVYATHGTGGMTHNDSRDRPDGIFGGKIRIHAGDGRQSYLLLPIIPPA
jgi:predicted acyl esterase